MYNPKQWLLEFGLNQKEVEIYLVIAKIADCRASDIQRETGYVRTSIYYALNQLKAQGLISENIENNIRTFRVTSTSVFRNKIEESITVEQARLNEVSEFEKYLRSITESKIDGSYVSRYEGTHAIKQAIEEALRCNSKLWYVLAAKENFLTHMPKKYQQYYLSERERRCITSKTLWESVEAVAPISLKNTALRSPRRLPEEFTGNFNSLVIMYDNSVLIIDPYDKKTAHIIHSAATSGLLRMMFMALWSSAETA